MNGWMDGVGGWYACVFFWGLAFAIGVCGHIHWFDDLQSHHLSIFMKITYSYEDNFHVPTLELNSRIISI